MTAETLDAMKNFVRHAKFHPSLVRDRQRRLYVLLGVAGAILAGAPLVLIFGSVEPRARLFVAFLLVLAAGMFLATAATLHALTRSALAFSHICVLEKDMELQEASGETMRLLGALAEIHSDKDFLREITVVIQTQIEVAARRVHVEQSLTHSAIQNVASSLPMAILGEEVMNVVNKYVFQKSGIPPDAVPN